MKATTFFIAYFLTASLIAALISYPIYQLSSIGAYDFERWVTRFALLFLIIGIYPCTKIFNLKSDQLGFNFSFIPFITKTFVGFLSGLAILAIVIGTLLILGVLSIKPNETVTLSLISTALLSGIVVALIEETLFRGLFFNVSLKLHNVSLAIILSSFFYAILHFIKPYSHLDPDSVNWLSGFQVIYYAFEGLSQLNVDDLLALFSVGVLLALVRFKTNTLAYCIGLHASWVLLLKITNKLTNENSDSAWSFLTGQYDGIIGLLVFFWLSIISISYIFVTRQKNRIP